MRIIFITVTTLVLFSDLLYSKPLKYKEFILGDSKKNILTILNKQKYSAYLIYLDSNDRFVGQIKVKSENSIKIVINGYMEREEILLVFDSKNILFDIYVKKKPMDIRDYIDHRIDMIENYGRPDEQQFVDGKYIAAWRLNRKRNAVYMIYSSANGYIIINIRDLYLNMKYKPVNTE